LVFGSVGSSALANKETPSSSYQDARTAYFALKGSKKKQRYRHNWFTVIAKFDSVRQTFPSSKEACRAVFTSAELWSDLHAISGLRSDLNRALDAYTDVPELCPKSSLADDALWAKGILLASRSKRREDSKVAIQQLLERYPEGDMAPRARRWARDNQVDLSQKLAPRHPQARGRLRGRTSNENSALQVTGMKSWNNPDYARIALYLTQPCEFRTGALSADTKRGKKARFYVDILGADLVSGFEKSVVESHDLIAGVRIGTPDQQKLRVVFDLAVDNTRPEVVVLENPFRIVVDVHRQAAKPGPLAKLTKPSKSTKPIRPVVVLDPGHGGKDAGAQGHGGVQEKQIALALSLEVKRILTTKGIDAVLTRDDDTFLSLEERTALANGLDADAFVSIHVNAHKKASLDGIETYYLDITHDRYALRLAAVENKVREERVSELQLTLAELSSRLFTEESSRLASSIQSRLVAASRTVRKDTRDLGVKSSLFYVLLGTRMPAVLIEAGFISNPGESKALRSKAYRTKLAAAIVDGIVQHLGGKSQEGS